MQNRWMRIIPSQSSTQKTIIWKFAGLRVNGNRTSHNYSERINSCQNCLKISQRRTFSFWKTKKVWNLWLQLYHQRILDKEQMMNFVRILLLTKYNLILPHVQNLIKLSLLFIFIFTLVLYFKQYLLQFYNKWLP